MAFTKFVEVGRVALINFGPLAGKLAIIVEIISTNRVLIDGPTTGVKRQEISLRRVSLTDVTISIPRGAKTSVVKKVAEEAKISEKFQNTPMGKRFTKTNRRTQLTDFERFKVMILKRRKRNATIKALNPKK
jgi:large subunit ribosomal protein L14e